MRRPITQVTWSCLKPHLGHDPAAPPPDVYSLPTRGSRLTNLALIMNNFYTQHRSPSASRCFGRLSFNFHTLTLALSCGFFAFGCGRQPAAKDPEITRPPITTAPVLTPLSTVSSSSTAPQAAKDGEQTAPTSRLADDVSRVRARSDAPGDRVAPEIVSASSAGADTGIRSDLRASDAARTQPPSSANEDGEEDVSAALRREVAEMERQRARQQP